MTLQSEHFIPTSHGQIFVRTWKTGSKSAPLILLHDSLGCVELWRDFPLKLATALQRDVVAYDRQGFGKSAPYPGVLPVSFIEDEAHGSFKAVCEHLKLDRFIVFGHSVAGGMAAWCAAKFPKSCEAMITVAAQSFVEDRTLAGIRSAEALFSQPGQMDRLARYHGEKANWVLRAWVDTWNSPPFRTWTLDEALRRVQCPVLALHGENDEYGSIIHPTRIAELTRGAADVLEDCGHVPHREKSDAVIAKVAAFLSRP